MPQNISGRARKLHLDVVTEIELGLILRGTLGSVSAESLLLL